MTASFVTDTHESWLNGSPEIAVHVAVYEQDDSVTWISCAGDGQSGDFHFDQNDNSWSGDVTIGSQAMLEDETYEVFLWEDDWNRCDGTNHFVPDQENDLLDQLTALGKAAIEIAVDPPESVVEALVTAVEKAYKLRDEVTNDDLIGVAQPIPGSCFNASTGAQEFTLRNLSGTYKGNVDLVNDFAEREKCPFKVQILGPDEARPFDYCTWTLSFSHGTGPYDIEWSGLVSGSGTTKSTTVTSSGWVDVAVTDANGEQDGDGIWVDVDWQSQQCLL